MRFRTEQNEHRETGEFLRAPHWFDLREDHIYDIYDICPMDLTMDLTMQIHAKQRRLGGFLWFDPNQDKASGAPK